ncbi:hypothetical protein KY289_016969 [Solanum tuberosum]|nr:hypothetical protein KY284_016757 [Solanum tuberosum]KAH0689611.1 hypothetical protein KY289_016969 [Solanum tuberosum]
MRNAIAASKAQTERNRKRRREGVEPEQPASAPMSIENSETESEDAAKYVAKGRREVEEERVKSKGNQKGGKKSHAKRVNITKQNKEQLVKGPGPRVRDQIEEKKLTRKERIEKMMQQKVLNDGTTGGGIKTIVKNVEIHLDKETLGIILGVPVVGIQTIEGCKPTGDFLKLATKRGDDKRAGLPKKFLKGEYQLMFEFINKVMMPRTE